MAPTERRGLPPVPAAIKRSIDVIAAGSGLILTSGIIVVAFVVATIDTRKSGFFTQERVGREGRRFRLIKIRTMRDDPAIGTTVTTSEDSRVTKLGWLLRRTKIDELPQLLNVLVGQMSLVGPRPDVPGFADELVGDDRIVLSVRPGITGPATLKYRHEETILQRQENPEQYNRDVIYPDKVRLNKEYVRNYRLGEDLRLILRTIIGT